jgi:hypothetical protein
MQSTDLAIQLVVDVLATRRQEIQTPFRMYAVEPDRLPEYRLALVRKFAHLVPMAATADQVQVVAAAIVPYLQAAARGV